MASGGGDEDGAKKSDLRVSFLRSRVASSLKLKDDTKFDRLFANEDSATAIAAFLDTSESNRLLIFDAGKGELAAVRALARWSGPQAAGQPCRQCEAGGRQPRRSAASAPPARRAAHRGCRSPAAPRASGRSCPA